MFELNGKYTNAIIYTDMIEQEAIAQIIELCNQPMFEGSTIRIMPDCHSGKGCVIGFTAKLSKKMIVPNLVGVDIGCGVLTTVFKAETPIDFKELDTFIRNNIPSGFSVRSKPSDKLKNKVRGKSWGTYEDVVRLVCKHINEDDNKINYHQYGKNFSLLQKNTSLVLTSFLSQFKLRITYFIKKEKNLSKDNLSSL